VLRLGTWNLRRLGHGDKDLARVARVFAELDVVALQEVMTPEGAEALLDHLPPGWRLLVTPEPVGRTNYREHYALLYRESAVRLTRWFTLDDPDDAFERDPLVACLAAGELDFCLVSIHVIYGRRVGPRDDEIRALAAQIEALRAAGDEKDWILVGDFNRPGSAPSWRELAGRGWQFCDGAGDTPTTLGRSGYVSAYDHIVFDPRHTAEWDGSCRRFDILVELCTGDPADCRSNVSDHAPMSAGFRTDGPDDD
jgi:endonuclease/exonuclease/phosphatase family metal-dependent hydrolase